MKIGMKDPHGRAQNLCQGCVMLKPEKNLHIPHEHPEIEKDVIVCALCYDRISRSIENDTDLEISVIGPRILGIGTKPSAYNT